MNSPNWKQNTPMNGSENIQWIHRL